MGFSAIGLGQAVCEATYQLGLSFIARSACGEPSSIGMALMLAFGGTVIYLAVRYWRVSSP